MIRHARALLLRCVLALPALLAALMLPLPAAAQQRYPAEVVKFIIPFPPGAATDVLARILIQELQATTGGTFVADNRTGALGIIGVTALSRAAPNGYTIGLSSISTHSTAAFMFRNLPYDALKNFEHISRLGLYSWILVSDPSHGFKSPADLVKAAKAKKVPVRVCLCGAGFFPPSAWLCCCMWSSGCASLWAAVLLGDVWPSGVRAGTCVMVVRASWFACG